MDYGDLVALAIIVIQWTIFSDLFDDTPRTCVDKNVLWTIHMVENDNSCNKIKW